MYREVIETKIKKAVAYARETCERDGVSFSCMRVWETVDSLVEEYIWWSTLHPHETADVWGFIDGIETRNSND